MIYFLNGVKFGQDGHWMLFIQELNFPNEFDGNRPKQTKGK